MIQNRRVLSPLAVIGLVVILATSDSLTIQAQGGVRLRLPFDGTVRLTANVDHDTPNYNFDGEIVVNNGERRTNCLFYPTANSDPYCYHGHDGTDYALTDGTPVLAAAADRVIQAETTDYGYTIKIDHSSGYTTLYGHLRLNSNDGFVEVGDRVVAGQQIALSGETGTDSPHLHFGVYHNETPTDPFGWRGEDADPLLNFPQPGQGETSVCLWGDGQCTAIITEDESAWYFKDPEDAGWNGYRFGNSWTLRYIANVHTDDPGDPVFARWRPNIPYAGPHSVFVFIPAARNKTTAAKYWVYDRDGLHFVTIDQSSYADEWAPLGSFYFWDGTSGYVRLYNSTGEPDGSTEVCYDSVKFQQFRIYVPLVLRNYCPGGCCVPAWTLGCGGSHTGNNGGSGSTDMIDLYPCSTWDESGPEYAYTFQPDVTGTATATLSNSTGDVDVFVLDGSGGICNPGNCIGYGNVDATFNTVSGETYYIVVDGYQGAVSDYTLTVTCN